MLLPRPLFTETRGVAKYPSYPLVALLCLFTKYLTAYTLTYNSKSCGRVFYENTYIHDILEGFRCIILFHVSAARCIDAIMHLCLAFCCGQLDHIFTNKNEKSKCFRIRNILIVFQSLIF